MLVMRVKTWSTRSPKLGSMIAGCTSWSCSAKIRTWDERGGRRGRREMATRKRRGDSSHTWYKPRRVQVSESAAMISMILIVRRSCSKIRNKICCIVFCVISSLTLSSSPSLLYYTLPLRPSLLTLPSDRRAWRWPSSAESLAQLTPAIDVASIDSRSLRPLPTPCNGSNILHSEWDWGRERKKERTRKGMRMD